jgi:hypothetical protein
MISVIGHVSVSIGGDGYIYRQGELAWSLPSTPHDANRFSLRREDLDTTVGAVSNPDLTGRIHCDSLGLLQLARLIAPSPPLVEEA